MRVRDLMSTRVVTVTPGMTLQQTARIFDSVGIDGAPVVDANGKLIGLVTKSHLIKALAADNFYNLRVGDVMTPDVFTLQENTTIQELQQNNRIFRYGRFPVVDGENRPIGFITRTDLVKYLSERSLFLADEMQAVLNSVCNGVIVTNADGIVTLFNPAAEYITGLSSEDVIGRFADDVIPNSGLQRVLKTGVAELNQKQHIGNCEIITNRTPIVKDNKIKGAVAIFQDITQLQAIAAELEYVKNLKSTLESAIESMFEGFVAVDKNGYITMMNQAYGEFLGVDAKEVIGRHVTEVIENTRMHIVAQTGKPEIGEVQRIGKHAVVVTRKPIIQDGEVVGAVGKILFKDVKDFKMLARKLNSLQSELEYYKEELRKVHGGKYTIESIVGQSEKMEWLKTIAAKAAKGNSTVLILGESGTGKELFAHAIHNASARRHGPFIKVNCAALPESLLESELFGYDEGAFTGARKGGKPGKIELANGGTFFLDEIGDMTLAMQAKLLRVLQEREIERVGGTKTNKVDVRIIAATNRDLEKMIERGEFRQDLYYRLNIISLHIPPLRERKEDIPLLCTALLKKINVQVQHWVDGVSPEAMELLLAYDWPGNVRELENVLERAVNLMEEDERQILPEHLPPALKKIHKAKDLDDGLKDLAGILCDTEKQAIYKALEATGGNKSKAAKLLGIHRSGFYQKLHKYNITFAKK
ncbi:sigma54 specific transcriptional regulator, Fis family [Thermosinus carboxydivorans Nor1]|uniref:Sigma54 specific transcriptional regulator, Fis family n=1 Tax=Thermosinus carboxydivorans Nor1 TaxID=401526 RepID=A1HPJ0_9FIRM|nr:sigma-54-dependent Fis family transcriptional regulator [Thermosinus carboxydivorans]EAX47964.1 sigma54 specific transcriptional regulator, Fis family [Thermosinus carboxydivorans Nor1]